MSLPNLSLIGESINDSVPSTQALFDVGDEVALRALAAAQETGGAAYIDVNVGIRGAEKMSETCKIVQAASRLPLSVDSPDSEIAEAGLRVCDLARGKPILNSISLRRTEMFSLYKIAPFRPILLATENESGACHTAEETVAAAKKLLTLAQKNGIASEDCLFDLGIAPIGSDSEGNLARLMNALRMMHEDSFFAGTHRSVGLSNFTVMLPTKTRGGELVKAPLESAFLTRAMPLGLDHVIGSVKRKYAILDEGNPAIACFDDCVKLGGFDAIMRVRTFYTS